MERLTEWNKIRKHFNKSFSSNFHVSVASVDLENNPTVTPIGSMFLNDNQTGFYFEKFPSKLPKHAKSNPSICILAVNSGRFFWIKSLFKGVFFDYPGIKLFGVLGQKRRATQKEINRLNRRMKVTNGLKSNTYLWKKMEYVREIKFIRAEKINIGKMTEKL